MQVFTYGTLMFPEVWRSVAGGTHEGIPALLRGFAAFRVRDAVFPGIVRHEDDAVVRGVLYFDVGAAAVARLDRFEDNFYVRQSVTVVCEDGSKHLAETYTVPSENRHVLTDEPWTRESFVTRGGLEEFLTRFAGFARMRDEAP
jgi:gamma-glutamylcyclotransferase (GGCT)/AIG2-like uncharacterized protein YtfP